MWEGQYIRSTGGSPHAGSSVALPRSPTVRKRSPRPVQRAELRQRFAVTTSTFTSPRHARRRRRQLTTGFATTDLPLRMEVSARGISVKLGIRDRAIAELARLTSKRQIVMRSPSPKKESKEQKQIDGAKKTLTDDLASEKKAQDKAAANALKGVDKAQSDAQKQTAKEEKGAAKATAKAEKGEQKAEADLTKTEKDKGKPGKAGKSYEKAEANEKKAEANVDKTKTNDAANKAKIGQKEDKSIAKTGQNLDKADTKAHTDQFGDKGARLAKSHPSAWQKFKDVMKKIGEGIEWAITGISLLIPGAEEAGLARLAAKGAEIIAEKAGKKGIEKAAEKGAKKGVKEGEKQAQNGQSGPSAVDAAKTESDAQVAAANANAQQGKDAFAAAAKNAQKPAGGTRRRDVTTDGRALSTFHGILLARGSLPAEDFISETQW
ncbi:hypothetical protein MMC19_005318 [Ptychographa xylographoides]|nr:hypothetical protein [Ptychographa xylographoides]